MSELTSASLRYRGKVKDALNEAMFFHTYGNMFSLYLADQPERQADQARGPQDPRELAVVKEALAAIGEGGYAAATARVAFLLARKGEPLPLSRLQLKKELIADYKDLLPAIPMDEARRVRGEQELVVRYEPGQAIATLAQLLPDPADRERLLSLLDRVLADQRVQKVKPSPEQLAMLQRIREALPVRASNVRKLPARSARRAA